MGKNATANTSTTMLGGAVLMLVIRTSPRPRRCPNSLKDQVTATHS
jgi:hypothetical protein